MAMVGLLFCEFRFQAEKVLNPLPIPLILMKLSFW